MGTAAAGLFSAGAVSTAVYGWQHDRAQQREVDRAASRTRDTTQADIAAMKAQLAAVQARRLQAAVAPPPPATRSQPSAAVAESGDLVAQLHQLSAMRDAGTLSETEFAATKTQLLATL
jgi:hypothetical protein